ncbi:hypothetical protein PAXRUDRAFT_827692 [Paxillus rubicundulus Ve08.2h10]|uniref:Uncharacterized protein n=1 Tax=Paxillus rubicundulus Ve08.2h10 TaxID=930991 RepID=A0A0D0DQK0_9AGAM|nr:hypothetical protein PAXRUDRAFT_827692 [Paxillus rubicundulus Ve08.2h10]
MFTRSVLFRLGVSKLAGYKSFIPRGNRIGVNHAFRPTSNSCEVTIQKLAHNFWSEVRLCRTTPHSRCWQIASKGDQSKIWSSVPVIRGAMAQLEGVRIRDLIRCPPDGINGETRRIELAYRLLFRKNLRLLFQKSNIVTATNGHRVWVALCVV